MSEKHDAFLGVMGKFAKILSLLASDKAGEVVSAAGRIVNLLASVNLDLHDIVGFLEKAPTAKPNSLFETDTEALVRIALAEASLFVDFDNVAFADIDVEQHRETWPLRSAEVSGWLTQRFFVDKNRIPTAANMRTAVHALGARASFSGKERHDVHCRVAEFGGKIYVDLANPAWQVVEIDKDSWRIVNRPPVRFRRAPQMRSLPTPERGGSIDALRPFVNLSDADFILLVSFMLDAYRVNRPHPVLYLAGSEGTAKSTATKIVASLIDPHRAKLRSLPAVHDLFVAAHNQSLLTFDNVSTIPAAVSDALCQIASGTGFAMRQKYTDSAEFSVTGSHPVVLNGIANAIDRPDLADRALVLSLLKIDAASRRSEAEFWDAFNAAQPKLLGALLDAVVHGLSRQDTVQTQQISRMADFERWANACETAFVGQGQFSAALAGNASDTVEGLIDNDPVAKAIGSLMLSRDNWEGTAAELLVELTNHDHTEAKVTRQAHWPKDPARFAKGLRAMTATLAKAGIDIEFGKAADRRRTRIVRLRNRASTESHPDRSEPLVQALIP